MLRYSLILLTFLPIPATANDCVPTPGRTIGTHYDISKATHQPGNLGKGLVMKGRVLSADDCRPLPGVKVLHWQAGKQGQYIDRLYAWRHTDDKGAYRFETEWPALRPPHVHFQVEAPGYQAVSTQWIANERVDEVTFDIVVTPIKK